MTTGSTVTTREPTALTGADLMGTARATLLAPFDLDRGELDRAKVARHLSVEGLPALASDHG